MPLEPAPKQTRPDSGAPKLLSQLHDTLLRSTSLPSGGLARCPWGSPGEVRQGGGIQCVGWEIIRPKIPPHLQPQPANQPCSLLPRRPTCCLSFTLGVSGRVLWSAGVLSELMYVCVLVAAWVPGQGSKHPH